MLKVRIDNNVMRATNRADAERLRTSAEKLHEARCYGIGAAEAPTASVALAPSRPVVRILSIPNTR